MPRRPAIAAAAVALVAAGLPLLVTSPASAAVDPADAWDFNGDGRADLAVGAPGATVGGAGQAGSVSVFLAGAGGAYTDSAAFSQDTAGVTGAPETGDQFGYAMTSADFDSDGYADLAVAANREDIGSGSARKTDAGLITVLWGSPSGLTGAGSVNLEFNPGGASHSFAYAGDALASGDMNGDGKAELAVGGPGIEYTRVYVGADKAAFGTTWKTVRESSTAGKVHSGDLFGEALAMGDFDDDGFDDLAIGVPYDSDDYGYSVGAVVVVPGWDNATQPLDVDRAKRWSPKTSGVQGSGHRFTINDLPDSFGRTLAAGDFDDDGSDDLAISAAGTPVARTKGGKTYEDAGRVHVLFGSSPSGLTATGNLLITQETAGVSGGSEKGDLFGASLDAGEGDTADLLAIGSAEQNVWVLPGASGTGSAIYNQETPDLTGGTEPGDAFGAFIRFVANTTADEQALAIGAPGENTSSGALYVLAPDAGGMPNGLESSYFNQDSDGVDGSATPGNAWGWLGDSH